MKAILSVWGICVLFVIIHVEAVTGKELKSLLARLSALEEKQAFSDKRIAALETENRVFQKRITDLEQFKTLADSRVVALKMENALCSRRNDANDIVKKLTKRYVVFETDKILSDKYSTTNEGGKRVREGASLENVKILLEKIIYPLANDHFMFPNRSGKDERRSDAVGIVHRQTAVSQPKQTRFVAEGIVAFSATKGATQEHVGINQNIIFDQVLTNEGGGFHSNHGVFIAPQSGLYVLSSTIMTDQNGEVHANIVHNGNSVTRIYGHGDSGRHDQGSQTIIIKMNAGDEVYVQNIDNPNDTIYGGLYSSFSGYLLWPQ